MFGACGANQCGVDGAGRAATEFRECDRGVADLAGCEGSGAFGETGDALDERSGARN
jgi:hypothetical protein